MLSLSVRLKRGVTFISLMAEAGVADVRETHARNKDKRKNDLVLLWAGFDRFIQVPGLWEYIFPANIASVLRLQKLFHKPVFVRKYLYFLPLVEDPPLARTGEDKGGGAETHGA